MLIAMFGSKFGTPTGEFPSGTVEEIDLFINANKPVALYFSDKSTTLSTIDSVQLEHLRDYRKSISNKAYYNVFKSTSQLMQLISRFLMKTAQRMYQLKNDPLQENNNPSNSIVLQPTINQKFTELLDQASRSNANGYWLSIVANFGNGYLQFESEQKEYVHNWSKQLLHNIYPDKPVSRKFGDDYVIVSCPVNDSYPPVFRAHYSNEGVVLIQWRGDDPFIPIDWVITLCLVSVVQMINSPIASKYLLRLGISLSNAPEQGINTHTVFSSTSTDAYLKSRNSIWESTINEDFNVDSTVKDFIRKTLSSWGYFDFENSLDNLIIKLVKQEFLLRKRDTSSLLFF